MTESDPLPWLLIPQPQHKISDKDWSAIVAASQLPDLARSRVEEAIALYRLLKTNTDSSGSPHQVRKLLSDTAVLTSKLQRQLKLVVNNPLAMHALGLVLEARPNLPSPQRHLKNILPPTIDVLSILAGWMKVSTRRVARAKPGAHRTSLAVSFAVASLSDTWKRFTGASITRSRKRNIGARAFIETTLRIADPKVGKSSIDEAMKRLIKGRGEITKKSKA